MCEGNRREQLTERYDLGESRRYISPDSDNPQT